MESQAGDRKARVLSLIGLALFSLFIVFLLSVASLFVDLGDWFAWPGHTAVGLVAPPGSTGLFLSGAQMAAGVGATLLTWGSVIFVLGLVIRRMRR